MLLPLLPQHSLLAQMAPIGLVNDQRHGIWVDLSAIYSFNIRTWISLGKTITGTAP